MLVLPVLGAEGCPLRAGFCSLAGGSQRGFRTVFAAVIQGHVSPWRRGLHLHMGAVRTRVQATGRGPVGPGPLVRKGDWQIVIKAGPHG